MNFNRAFVIVAFAALAIWLLFIAISPAAKAANKECFPLASIEVSFSVVFPNAKQFVLTGDTAKAYLAEYNSFGRPTRFQGDALFLNILPNGTAMLIPIKNGIGCHRMIVGPKLHRVIMAKVSRSAI